MEGARGIVAQRLYASQGARAPMGVYAQSLSGNRRGAFAMSRIASGFVSPTGTGGAETFALNMPALGARAGDICIFYLVYPGPPSPSVSNGDGGWSSDSFTWGVLGYTSWLFWKSLTVGDLISNLTLLTRSIYRVCYVIYRGPRSLTVKQKQSDDTISATTQSFSGFSKSINCKGILAMIADRDGTGSPMPDPYFNLFNAGSDNAFNHAMADLLGPRDYVDGTILTWRGFSNAAYGQTGFLVELT